MMIKIFTTDKDGKIAFTVDELKQLLYEAFQEGYHSKGNKLYIDKSELDFFHLYNYVFTF